MSELVRGAKLVPKKKWTLPVRSREGVFKYIGDADLSVVFAEQKYSKVG